MRSLQDFASNQNQPLFPQASALPEFFHNNLVDPARVVKVFHNDPQANIRIFYYQYLKLCFQLDDADYEGYISKIQQIINNEGFKFIFYEDDDPSIFSDLQFKSLITQFFGILGDGNIPLDDAINRYPIMDTVFIYFFRALLILTGKTESLDSYIERDQLLQYLCSYFGVAISLHDRCIKFVETDIFAYEEDPKDVYMAFMDYERLQNQQNASHSYNNESQNLPQQQQEYHNQQQPTHYFDQPIQEHNPMTINLKHPVIKQSPPISQEDTYLTKGNLQLDIDTIKHQKSYQIPAYHNNYESLQHNSSGRNKNEANQSYIASDFVDYTHSTTPANTLSSLIPSNSLKESGTLDLPKKNNFESIVKNQTPNRVVQPTNGMPYNKTNGFKPQPQKSNSYADSLSYSAQTNTNTYGYGSIQDKNYSNQTSGTASYTASRSNLHSDLLPIEKKVQENKYITQVQWQPTKDPGFALKNNSNPPYQPPNKTTYQPQTSLYKPTAQQYKPPSPIEAYKQIPIQSYKLSNTDQYKPSSYTPYVPSDINYSDSKKNIFPDNKPQSAMTTYNPSYQNQYSALPVSKPAQGKNPFGLNVSIQFTNSFTLKIMSEPFRSNVATIRTRARNFRNSLTGFIK